MLLDQWPGVRTDSSGRRLPPLVSCVLCSAASYRERVFCSIGYMYKGGGDFGGKRGAVIWLKG